jgi:hypothetical protein
MTGKNITKQQLKISYAQRISFRLIFTNHNNHVGWIFSIVAVVCHECCYDGML